MKNGLKPCLYCRGNARIVPISDGLYKIIADHQDYCMTHHEIIFFTNQEDFAKEEWNKITRNRIYDFVSRIKYLFHHTL